MMYDKEYYLKQIRNRKRDFLSYDIDFENTDYSLDFLKFYCSFMIWNMGHARLEHNFEVIESLNVTEKNLALTLIEENFKNSSLIDSFLYSLYYFKNQNETEEFVKRKLLECKNESLFHSYITILRAIKEQRHEINLDFHESIKIVMEKGEPEHIINLLWSSKTLLGEKYIEICNFYKDHENTEIRDVVKQIIK